MLNPTSYNLSHHIYKAFRIFLSLFQITGHCAIYTKNFNASEAENFNMALIDIICNSYFISFLISCIPKLKKFQTVQAFLLKFKSELETIA